jgi:hypothetical protein
VGESGGENAKFGLSTVEMLAATRAARRGGNLAHCFKLLHFHIGSQVPDILTVKRAVQEAARYYAKLRKMGFPIEYIDVGGGLASTTTARAFGVRFVDELLPPGVHQRHRLLHGRRLQREKVPHPDIVSESGRAIVAHHSVLIVEAFGSIDKTQASPTPSTRSSTSSCKELARHRGQPRSLNKLEALGTTLLERKEDAQKMFELGLLELPDKAKVEALYWEISRARRRQLPRPGLHPRGESAGLEAASATSTSAISPCSSRCSITGRSAQLFPDHAHASARRTPTRGEHAGRHHLRLRRSDQQVHRPPGRARHAAAAPEARPTARARTTWVLPHGRLPGHHGRPPQPLRPRQRGPRVPR